MTEWKSAIAQAIFGRKVAITIVGVLRADLVRQVLDEGKWINGRYEGNIRVDRDTHFSSTDANGVHAHVYGRRDRDNALVAVRLSGGKSHNLGGKLHKGDADALRRIGFAIPSSNLVEWMVVKRAPAVLLREQLRG